MTKNNDYEEIPYVEPELSLEEVNRSREELNRADWSVSAREGLGYKPVSKLTLLIPPPSSQEHPEFIPAYVIHYTATNEKGQDEPRQSKVFSTIDEAEWARTQIGLRPENRNAQLFRTRDRRYDG